MIPRTGVIFLVLLVMNQTAHARNVILPETYGASHSTLTLSCDTTLGSDRLVCPGGVGDFKVGQGIDIPGVGAISPVPLPAELALTVNGKPGQRKFTYALCSADLWKGIAGCIEASVDNAPDALDALNNISFTYAINLPNAGIWLVYRRVNDGNWAFITTLNGGPFRDSGWTQPDSAGWPASPPDAVIRQDFFSTIKGVDGDTITTADMTPTSVKGAILKHDDVLAVQAAYDACDNGTVQFGPYRYRLVRPSVWNFTMHRFYYTYTTNTPGYPALFAKGVLHPPSHCATLGMGRGKTYLLTDFMNMSNGGLAVFGLDTGTHSNPLYSDLPAYHIGDAAAGSRSVKAVNAKDVSFFSAGAYVLIYGGGAVAGAGSGPSEINQVVSTDSESGIIKLTTPLEKPMPLGPADTPPAIINLTGNIVTDVSFSHMTIETYSAAFGNSSAVYHAHMSDLDLPFLSNGEFWYGGYRRDWTNLDIDLAGTSGNEIDLDEDFLWERGSCHSITGRCFTITEGSSNVKFHKTHLTADDQLANYGGLISMQDDINGIEITNSTFNQTCSTSNVQDTSVIGSQGGLLEGYVPAGFRIEGNTITTNCRRAILVSTAHKDLLITRNMIRQTLADSTPWNGIFAGVGNILDNIIEVTEPDGAGDRNCAITGYPGGTQSQMASAYSWNVRGNTVRINGNVAHCGVFVGDPGMPYRPLITITGNYFENIATGIFVVNPTNTPDINLGPNQCPSCSQMYSPGNLSSILKGFRNQTPAANH